MPVQRYGIVTAANGSPYSMVATFYRGAFRCVRLEAGVANGWVVHALSRVITAARRPVRIRRWLVGGVGLGLLVASAWSSFFWWWAIGAGLFTTAVVAAAVVAVRGRPVG
jgi:hypothetical protein